MIVIGVGNELRGDDAVGLEVVRRLAASGLPQDVVLVEAGGDPAALVECWGPGAADDAIVVDAACSGAPAGTIRRFDALAGPLPAGLRAASTHALGVAEAIEIARALRRLPRSLVVHAIEGERFELGEGLSPSVERAAERLAGWLGAELRSPSGPLRSFPQTGWVPTTDRIEPSKG